VAMAPLWMALPGRMGGSRVAGYLASQRARTGVRPLGLPQFLNGGVWGGVPLPFPVQLCWAGIENLSGWNLGKTSDKSTDGTTRR